MRAVIVCKICRLPPASANDPGSQPIDYLLAPGMEKAKEIDPACGCRPAQLTGLFDEQDLGTSATCLGGRNNAGCAPPKTTTS